MGAEAVIEEAFVDVFCDLVYGGGWMDIEREYVDRECNWALVSIGVCLASGAALTYLPADRIQGPPAIEVYNFWRHGPTYIHDRLPLRGIRAARISPTALSRCSE
jgi:hypothetical protein